MSDVNGVGDSVEVTNRKEKIVLDKPGSSAKPDLSKYKDRFRNLHNRRVSNY